MTYAGEDARAPRGRSESIFIAMTVGGRNDEVGLGMMVGSASPEL